jgi:hypothetical protein
MLPSLRHPPLPVFRLLLQPSVSHIPSLGNDRSLTDDRKCLCLTDGIINGWTPNGGDETKEWTTSGSMTNGWLLLTWPGQISMSSVALYDRINLNE